MLLNTLTLTMLSIFSKLRFFAGPSGATAAALGRPSTQDETEWSELVPRVDPIGINCKGSGICGSILDHYKAHEYTNGSSLEESIELINDDDHYHEGQNFMCDTHNVCAFLQNVGESSSTGKLLKKLFWTLRNECEVCGSIPAGYFDGNYDIRDGELTLNFIDFTSGCVGVCTEEASNIDCGPDGKYCDPIGSGGEHDVTKYPNPDDDNHY